MVLYNLRVAEVIEKARDAPSAALRATLIQTAFAMRYATLPSVARGTALFANCLVVRWHTRPPKNMLF